MNRNRCARLACCLLAASVVIPSPALRAQVSKDHKLDTGKRPLHVTYYRSRLESLAAVVVLFHSHGENRGVWCRRGGFAEKLQAKGYAVIAADFRTSTLETKTGKNAKKRTRQKTPKPEAKDHLTFNGDMEAIKRFLLVEHQKRHLNMRKMSIIASGMSGPLAVSFASRDWAKAPLGRNGNNVVIRPPNGIYWNRSRRLFDEIALDKLFRGDWVARGQDVRTLILLSPERPHRAVALAKSVRFLNTVRQSQMRSLDRSLQLSVLSPAGTACLVCVGKSGSRAPVTKAKEIYEMFSRGNSRDVNLRFKAFPVKEQGTDLLGAVPQLEQDILDFLNQTIGQLKDPWRSRSTEN